MVSINISGVPWIKSIVRCVKSWFLYLVAKEGPAEMCTQKGLKRKPHTVPRLTGVSWGKTLWLHAGTEARQASANIVAF